MYRVVKWTMLVLCGLYLLAVFLVPFFRFLRTDLLAWILYVAFVLMTVFVWGIGGKAKRTVGQGMDLWEKNEDIKVPRRSCAPEAIGVKCKPFVSTHPVSL